jgi:hypothetical protein
VSAVRVEIRDTISDAIRSASESPLGTMRQMRPCCLSRNGVSYALPLPVAKPCGVGLCCTTGV